MKPISESLPISPKIFRIPANTLAVLLVISAAYLAFTSESHAAGAAEMAQEIRAKVAEEIQYEFGTVVEIDLVPGGDAIKLICSGNSEEVEEILIWASPEHLYTYCVYPNGSISGGGRSWKKVSKSYRQSGSTATISTWKHKDGKILFKLQLTYPEELPSLTSTQRVEGFTRLWTAVKFNFANFDLVPEVKWDDVLTEYLPKVMQDQTNGEYERLLYECIARLKDSHTSVNLKRGSGFPAACPPLRIRSVQGKAVVVATGMTDEIKASGIKVGDEITHVDGRPIRQLLEKDVYPYVFASSPQGRDLVAYPRLLNGQPNTEVSVRILTLDGETREASLTRKSNGRRLIPNSNKRWTDFEYRELKNGIAYVAINTFGNRSVVEKFNKSLDQINAAKGLIIDVRKNGGGNSGNGDAIIACLIDKAIPGTIWKTPQYRAAFRAWGSDEQWYGGENKIKPKNDHPFLGPIVVLIGPETFSAAEDFVVPLHAAERATIVGQRTGGSTGQPLQFRFLDGRITGRICTKRDTYPDGREFIGIGIIPDVEVNPTVDDIVNDRDVVLQRGIKVIKTKLKG